MKYRTFITQAIMMVGVLVIPGTVAAGGPMTGDVFADVNQQAKPAEPGPPDHANGRQPNALDGGNRGQAAIDAAGDRLPDIARRSGLSEAELSEELVKDNSLVVTDEAVAYVEEITGELAQEPQTSEFPTGETPPLTEAFNLSSRPGSNRTIYLDFNGHVTQNSYWNSQTQSIVSDPWDQDGDPTTFSASERQHIVVWWQQLASDFAPFDVNVTTKEPPLSDLVKLNSTDLRYGVRAVISPTNFYSLGAAGVAYVNSFNFAQDAPVFTFTRQVGGNMVRNVAEVTAHELGHAFGLRHDGAGTTAYYMGHDNWVPIMGYPLVREIAQWSKGDYPNATNTQDDLAVIAASAPLVTDDVGVGDARKVLKVNTKFTGVISNANDVDEFSVPAFDGTLDIDVAPTDIYSALNAEVIARDARGAVVGVSNQPADRPESLTLDGNAGPFVISVDGVGEPNLTIGYTDYGSVGSYTIAVAGTENVTTTTTAPPTTTTAPPTTTTAPPTTTTAPPTTTTPPTTTVPDVAVRVSNIFLHATPRFVRANVQVRTSNGALVPNVKVVGDWFGGAVGARVATTGTDGLARTRRTAIRGDRPVFRVRYLELPDGYKWDGVRASKAITLTRATPRVRVVSDGERVRARVTVTGADGRRLANVRVVGRWVRGARGW